MNYYAVIVAGGSGNRMNNSIPKQFLLLDGLPVMMHAIQAFFNCPQKPQIIIVLGRQLHQQWIDLCTEHNFLVPHDIAYAGEYRFHSVKNGLATISGEGIVAIHDAARPLVAHHVINTSYRVAFEKGNCIVGIASVDSVRAISPDGLTSALDRSQVKLVQTPQTFRVNELKRAYEVEFRSEFTDDASVMEYYGAKINIVEGNRENIKITYPEDLDIASILIKKRP